MKIKTIEAENFKSFKTLKIENLGNINTFVGKNSSGKSNIAQLIRIFFNFMERTHEVAFAEAIPELWYLKDTANPIKISLSFELNNKEKEVFGEKEKIVPVTRGLVERKKIVATVVKYLTFSIELDYTGGWKLSELTYGGTDYKNKFEEIKTLLTNKLQYIPVTRNQTEGNSTYKRNSIILKESLTELVDLETKVEDNKLDRQRRKLLSILRKTNSISKFIRGYGDKIYIDIEDVGRISIGEIGGGDQEFIQLILTITTTGFPFIIIEEPEVHLHNDLQRQLYTILENFSKDKQVFITTHSTVFIDKAKLKNTYLVSYDGIKSEVKNLSDNEDLIEILQVLGIKPSDIFHAEKILFVEGTSDRVFFNKVSEKLNMSFFKNDIGTISLGGVGKGKRYLALWNEITKINKIPKYFILDKGTQKEADKLKKSDKTVEYHVLKLGDLEDYYPNKLILDGLKSIYKFDYIDDERKNFNSELLKSKKKCNTIIKILRDKKILKDEDMENKNKVYGWKFQLAEYIGENIKKNEINEEIETTIKNANLILR